MGREMGSRKKRKTVVLDVCRCAIDSKYYLTNGKLDLHEIPWQHASVASLQSRIGNQLQP